MACLDWMGKSSLLQKDKWISPNFVAKLVAEMEAKRPTFDAAHSPNMRRVHKAKHADPTASTASTTLDGAGQTSLAKAFVFHPSENSPQVDAFVANGLDVVLHAGAGGSVPVKPNRKIPKVAKVPRPSQVLA
ncbi:hypothetical protein DYB26_012925 [Aphanomyces astaci]|uniref:Uncharacterized protein n=1 Tax=Aphanomyces astaci TaxID=112090 RepID=A0A3R7ACK6_APHAT|nr:hypothetical protein DYB26_012925 [Aphanomyces astaci]